MAASLTVLSPEDIRKAYLRVVRAELIARGVANPNVLPQSDYAVRAEAISQQISPAMANSVIAAEANMPDTCIGDRLVRWLTILNLEFRGAQTSNGYIVHSASASGYVPVDSQLVDDQGQFYEVTLGGTYANGASIPIQSISTGRSTNRAAGTVLQWVSPPPYANSKVVVATGGLIDGADADTETVARNRLLNRLRYAPGGGNWSETVDWAEESSSSVVAAFDYPALRGPATYGLWALGVLTFDSTWGFSRQLSNTRKLTVRNYVQAKKPPESQINMPYAMSGPPSQAWVEDQETSVSVYMELPASLAAGGPGGGWIDTIPWPVPSSSETRILVTTIYSSTSLLLEGELNLSPDPSQIVDGETQISWFDPVSWWNSGAETKGPSIQTSTIISHSGSTGSVTVSLDPTHPYQLSTMRYVFPACENAEAYALAWIAAFEAMGPGQWTDDPNRLPRAQRYPLPIELYPCDLTGWQLRRIMDACSEILDAAYAYRNVSAPSILADFTVNGPRVLVPDNVAFYPMP
jgi:hypothetical protein